MDSLYKYKNDTQFSQVNFSKWFEFFGFLPHSKYQLFCCRRVCHRAVLCGQPNYGTKSTPSVLVSLVYHTDTHLILRLQQGVKPLHWSLQYKGISMGLNQGVAAICYFEAMKTPPPPLSSPISSLSFCHLPTRLREAQNLTTLCVLLGLWAKLWF